MTTVIVILLVCLIFTPGVVPQGGDEDAAREWAEQYNVDASVMRFASVDASWNYNTNLTDHNLQISVCSIRTRYCCLF